MSPLEAAGALWAGIGPAVGIVLGWYLSRRSQREGYAREDRHRHRAEKVAAYSAFLAQMEAKIEGLIGVMNLAQVGTAREDADGDTADPSVPLQTIVILAPDVAEPAQRLYDYSVMFGLNVLSRRLQSMGLDTERQVPDFDAEEYHRLRDRVVEAMRVDLG